MANHILEYKQLDDETRLIMVSESGTLYYYLAIQHLDKEDEEIYRSEVLEDVVIKFKEY